MALILSAATGNFNAGATWVGGIIPGVGDEARASTTHTITITANVTCTELSNAGTGTFVMNSGVTLTANVTSKSTTASVNCLSFSSASPASAFIVGNISGGTSASCFGVQNASTGTLTITGSATGGSGANSIAVYNSSTGILNITGNCFGNLSGASVAINNVGAGTTNITGNVTGGNVSASHGVFNQSNGTINVSAGVITGGGNSASNGVNNSSTGSIILNANIISNIGAGVLNASTGPISITGSLTANNNAHALQCTNTTGATINLSGSLISAPNGLLATNCDKFLVNPSPSMALVRFAKNGTSTYSEFYTADSNLGQAAITDVRFGTVYANGALTGVAYIPAAGSVAAGTPVDNTVGTATLTAANVRAALGMASANLDTQLAAIPTAITNAAAVRTNLATELARIDATISSRSTLTAANVRTELTPELTQVTEVHKIHGLDIANALTVTPTLRSAGAITQAITGDGTTSTIVTRV